VQLWRRKEVQRHSIIQRLYRDISRLFQQLLALINNHVNITIQHSSLFSGGKANCSL
jgi:hypothetical protein